ncbi:MAG: zinc-ribbon domain-containing protein, partial [Cyclobacteriaceae bacterium]|nr:zinc-ribbon domain-containing protein [Cyclobacteriaceae bacterium]
MSVTIRLRFFQYCRYTDRGHSAVRGDGFNTVRRTGPIKGIPMQIPCVSCQSLIRLDSDLVKPTGSLVRCSECKYIFMVSPQTLKSEPIIQDTNIDQSILVELFEVEQKFRATQVPDKNSTVMSKYEADEIASIEDIDQSILFELFEVEQKFRATQVPDKNSTVMSKYEVDEIASIEDFEEE